MTKIVENPEDSQDYGKTEVIQDYGKTEGIQDFGKNRSCQRKTSKLYYNLHLKSTKEVCL